MIKLEKIFVLLFLLGLSVRMSAVGLDKRFQILPLPQQMEIQKGKGISAGELSFVTMKGEGEIPVLGNMLDALPRYAVKGVKGVTLSMTEKDVPVSPEGYVLEVSSKGIAIRARSQAGLFGMSFWIPLSVILKRRVGLKRLFFIWTKSGKMKCGRWNLS